jgi:transposase
MRIKKELNTPVLSELIKSILTKMSRSRSISSSLTKRATIVLLASEGKTNQDIGEQLHMHYNNVATWRKRFIQATPVLQKVETSEPEKLTDEIKSLLSDKHRCGCPATYTQEQIVQIIDLACKSPSDFGYEVSQWSLNLLVSEILKQGICEQMSAKSVSRFLKRSTIKTT